MIALARTWWALAIRGLFAVSFGVAAFAWPRVTIAALVLAYGCYAMADGVCTLLASFASRGKIGFSIGLLFQALTGIAVAVVTFAWPEVTALALLYLIAAWAIVVGAFEIYVAYRLQSAIPGEWVLALGGLLTILLGAILTISPDAGAVALVRLIGATAVLVGLLFLCFAVHLRREWFRLLELSF